MRLINTKTLELREFLGYKGDYATLSHRWQDDEATLQDFREYVKRLRSYESRSPSAYVRYTGRRPPTKRMKRSKSVPSSSSDDSSSSDVKSRRRAELRSRRRNLHWESEKESTPSDSESAHESSSRGNAETLRMKPGIQKVLKFCRKARQKGYKWAWIDTVGDI